MHRLAVRKLASKITSLSEAECAQLMDLVATRMVLSAANERWISIRDAVRQLEAVSHAANEARAIVPRPARDRVLAIIEARTGISRKTILSRMVSNHVSLARHMAMAFLRESEGLSLPKTSLEFGKTHGAVWRAERELRDRYETSASDRALIDAVRSDLGMARWPWPIRQVNPAPESSAPAGALIPRHP